MDKLSLYFITWNVATRAPGESVRNLLDLGRFPVDELPDFYFIGLQEVKSQPQNFLIDALLEDPWTNAFKNALSSHDYVKVKTVRLVGILLNVFCQRKHLVHLRNMESQTTKTGLKGLWGNKGATSLRFQIYGVNLCVVNAHFAAHEYQLKQRISDYNTVINEQTFSVDGQTTRILYHDYVFWIGDLNFRLNNPDGVLTQDSILQKIKDVQLNELLEEDQLTHVRRSGEAFSELNETNPTFQPTYKYYFDSHNYDPKRRAAWTDRILYKVNENNYEDVKLTLEQLKYTSLQDYGTSDHKPVLSEFKIKICPTIFADGCLPSIESDGRMKRDAPHSTTGNVAFDPIESWTIDDINIITVNFASDFQPNPWDWIGVYADNFASLDDYLCYIYVAIPVNEALSNNETAAAKQTNFINTNDPLVSSSLSQKHLYNTSENSENSNCRFENNVCSESDEISRNKTETIGEDKQRLSNKAKNHLDSLRIRFPDSAIRYEGKYRLIYFTKNSSDVLGISNSFQAVHDVTRVNGVHSNFDW